MLIIEEVQYLRRAVGIRWNHEKTLHYYQVEAYPQALADWDWFRPWNKPESRTEPIYMRIAAGGGEEYFRHNLRFFQVTPPADLPLTQHLESIAECLDALSQNNLILIPSSCPLTNDNENQNSMKHR